MTEVYLSKTPIDAYPWGRELDLYEILSEGDATMDDTRRATLICSRNNVTPSFTKAIVPDIQYIVGLWSVVQLWGKGSDMDLKLEIHPFRPLESKVTMKCWDFLPDLGIIDLQVLYA